MTGGYDPTSTRADASLIRAQASVYRRSEINQYSGLGLLLRGPAMCSRASRSTCPRAILVWAMAAGAHAPDEYYVIESTNTKLQGMDGAAFSYVEYLHELAATT